MKKLTLALFFVLIGSIGIAQNREIDSLKYELSIARHDTMRVWTMTGLADSYRFRNQDSALFYAEKAVYLAHQIKFTLGEIWALSVNGAVLHDLGNLPKALELEFKALKIAEDSQNKLYKGGPIIFIGRIYTTLNDFPKALYYGRLEKEIFEPTNIEDSKFYAKENLALIFEKMNQLDSALYYLQEADKNNTYVRLERQGSYITYGNVNFKLGNYPLALSYYKKNLALSIENKNHQNASRTLIQIARLFQKQNQTDSSIFYAKKGLVEAQLVSHKQMIFENSIFLSELFEPKDVKEAFRYHKLAINTKDSLFGAGNIQAMQSMIADDEARRKEVEAEKNAYQNKLKQYGLLTGLGIMFLIGFILYRNNRQKQQANKVLENTLTELKTSQTQLELKNRDLEIEGALERVRAVALAMQNSNELIKVADVMRQQMGLLGQPDLETSAIHLYSEDSDSFDSWYAFRDGNQSTGKISTGIANFKNDSCATVKEFVSDYYSKIGTYTLKLEGQKLEEWRVVLLEAVPIIKENMDEFPKVCYFHFSDFSGGSLLMVTYKPPTDEAKYLQKRCANVFDLAYRRFLDLQKAEAQTERTQHDLIQIQTEKKRAEDALTILKATQNQLIQSEKLASLGELTAGIAHEIQNPLNFVNNFSELSVDLIKEIQDERQKTREERDEALEDELLSDLSSNQEKINHHGKRASSIVKGMLEHSRTSTGTKELTDINKLADEYLRLSYHGLRAKDNTFNADFKTDFDENLPKVEVIPQDFGRVLLNLINNAFYAVKTVEKPLVVVKIEQFDNQIIVKVKDNGTGMSEATKAKIFQPFFTTKPTGQGTGLGLSLAYDIVTKGHGGTLEVETKEGEGTEFVIKIPIMA